MGRQADSAVGKYFDSVAGSYNAASSQSIWRRIREREAATFMGLVGDVAGREVLELGCGAGYYTRLLLDGGASRVVAVDISEKMLAALPPERVEPVLADATALDLGRRFDVLISAGMLEFVPDPVAALRSAARHAAPGARLSILYPTLSVLGRVYRMFHRRHGFTVKLFDDAVLTRMLDGTGWRLDRTVASGPFSACASLVCLPSSSGDAA